VDKNNSCYSKKSGIPLKIVKRKFKDCLLVTDGSGDCCGAKLARIPCILIQPRKIPLFLFDKQAKMCHYGVNQ
jgi:hypothetical protein